MKVKFKYRDLIDSTPFNILHTNVSCYQDEFNLRYQASPAVVLYISAMRETFMGVLLKQRQVVQVKWPRPHCFTSQSQTLISYCTVMHTQFLPVDLKPQPW